MSISKFIKKTLFLLFISLIMPYQTISAKDWFKLNIIDKDKIWYINVKSILQNGKYTYYWCKVIYLKPESLPSKNMSYTKVHFISDCYRNLMSITEIIGYSKNKKILFRESSKNFNELNPIIPNSTYQSLHNLVCKYALYSD